MLLSPYVCYLVASGQQLSGIVAILTNGIFLNYYATPNISRASRKVLKLAYETIAYSSETLIFIFLGIGIFGFDHPYEEMGWGTITLAILNINISRFLQIMIVTFFINRNRSQQTQITGKHQFVMWISGLRGAMAYALAMESAHNKMFQNKDSGKVGGSMMLIITLIYSQITILGIGSILNPTLRKCDVMRKKGEDGEPLTYEQLETSFDRRKQGCCLKIKEFLSRFDHNYFSPLFIKDMKRIEKRDKLNHDEEQEDDRKWADQSQLFTDSIQDSASIMSLSPKFTNQSDKGKEKSKEKKDKKQRRRSSRLNQEKLDEEEKKFQTVIS